MNNSVSSNSAKEKNMKPMTGNCDAKNVLCRNGRHVVPVLRNWMTRRGIFHVIVETLPDTRSVGAGPMDYHRLRLVWRVFSRCFKFRQSFCLKLNI